MSAEPLALSALGIATPLGCGKAEVAANLFAGWRGGLVERDGLVPGRPVMVGAVTADLPDGPVPELDCRNNRLLRLALDEIAAEIAAAKRRYGPARIAVVLGTSTSGNAEAIAALAKRDRDGAWPQGFVFSRQEMGNIAEFAARYLALDGPAYTISTACTSSAKTFGSARRLIRAGLADAAIVGGADTLCALTLTGFDSLSALSRSTCNPSSRNRDGITIGEGAAAFLLEPGPGEIAFAGLGETSDAHHVSAPDPEGRGAAAAMQEALDDGGLAPHDIVYVNLHGTATPLNDVMEHRAVNGLFGPTMAASSTKAMTGHMLGAAGGCEAAFAWLTLSRAHNPRDLLPPHLWDGAADPELAPLDLVAPGQRMRAGKRPAILSNSFAFGGSNAALVLARRSRP
jgi:3-oxoacyl-[acyl-carrier-protein] synthase-1